MFVKIAALATLSLLVGAGGLAKPQDNNRVLNENRTITPVAERTQMTDLSLTEDSYLVENWTVYAHDDYNKKASLCDGNENTILWLWAPGNNSYIEFNLGSSLTEIYDISIVFGPSDTNWLTKGHWEWSNNAADYMTCGSFEITSKQNATVKTYGIKANRLRLYPSEAYGDNWVQLAEIKINQGTYDSDGEIQRIEFHGFGRDQFPTDVVGIKTGYNNVIDGDPSTYARTAKPAVEDYIEFEWASPIQFKTIQYQNATIASTTDRIYGAKIQYYNSGWQDAMSDSSEYFNDGYSLQLFDLRLNPITTNLIRFVITRSDSWATVGDFYFNNLGSDTPIVTTTIDSTKVNGDLNNVIDGNFESTVYYDWNFSSGSYIQLYYEGGIAANNIYFLQGGHTPDSYHRQTIGNDDSFPEAVLEYGPDLEHLTPSSTYYASTKDVILTLNEPTIIHYIRMRYTGSTGSSTGVVVREFGVNLVKQDPVVVDWSTEATYNGHEQVGYYYYPYNSGMTVTYKQGEDTLAGAPTNPGLYSITMSTSGNSVYNAYNETKSFHIYDSSTHFISEWEDKIVAGLGGNVCNQFGEGDNVLKQLIRIYDNHMKAADKETVDAHTYEDSRGITVSIADTIAYAKAHIEEFGGSNSLNINLNNSQTGVVSITVVVAATLSVTALFFLISKKRKHQ